MKREKTDSRKYTGIVEDCCYDYETIGSFNGEILHPLLQELWLWGGSKGWSNGRFHYQKRWIYNEAQDITLHTT
ncbi:hypothetical protein CsSME_00036319 [Camellia sinensis var. sinensis]